MGIKYLATGLAVGLALLTATLASAGTLSASTPDARPAPIADTDLAEMSGGQAPAPLSSLGLSAVLTNQTATNSNNQVNAGGNVSSGDMSLGQGSLQGFAGIGNFVFNTGHNNNLLGNLSVAINMMQAAAGTPAP